MTQNERRAKIFGEGVSEDIRLEISQRNRSPYLTSMSCSLFRSVWLTMILAEEIFGKGLSEDVRLEEQCDARSQ